MKLALHALLWCSGAAGLAYEICWSRQLGVWLGHGERASALTLSIFFMGMAAGYLFAARALRSSTRPLRSYALCELAISACALSLPWLHPSVALHPYLWLVLLPPTFAMGASLPFIMHAVAASGESVARAYATHLLGATVGSVFTTFWGIEHAGLWGTTSLAAALSAACGLSAWLLPARPSERGVATAAPALRFQIAAAWAGAATLALQVLTLRLFALTFHNSTYTFGLTLAVFIVFLALGSRWVSRREARTKSKVGTVGRGALLAAFFVLTIVPLFAAMTRFGELRAPSFSLYIGLATGLVATVLALPVMAAGSLLPALFSAAQGKAGETVGSLSAANSVGAALGALAASFVLLPVFGLLGAFAFVAAAYFALALLIAGFNRRTPLWFASLVVLGVWTQTLEPGSPPGFLLLKRWETPYGWVDLLRSRSGEALSARLDLHYQLGSSVNHPRHLGMGQLPLLLHPKPERTLFVGLATGMTASAALEHSSVTHIEVVELIHEMEAVTQRFSEHNASLLDDERVHLTFEDGRTYLQRTRKKFDVIVSDLFVPWHSHAGYLYTVEHYQAVYARLSARGIFAQWLPVSQLGSEELELVGASFSRAFAHTSVWLDDTDPELPLLAILGHRRAQDLPPRLGRARYLGPFRPAPGAELNTDEHPLVELRMPRTERDQRLLSGRTLTRYLAERFHL